MKKKKTSAAKTKQITIQGEKLKITKGQKHRKVDVGKALEQRIRGLSLQEIANTHQVSITAIHNALAPYKDDIERLRIYAQNKPALQEMAAGKLLNEILTKDMESEKLSSLGSVYDILAKNYRLETGQSTSNVSIKIADLSQFRGENLSESEETGD